MTYPHHVLADKEHILHEAKDFKSAEKWVKEFLDKGETPYQFLTIEEYGEEENTVMKTFDL